MYSSIPNKNTTYLRLLSSVSCRVLTLGILYSFHLILIASLVFSIFNASFLQNAHNPLMPVQRRDMKSGNASNTPIATGQSIPGFTCPVTCSGGSICEFKHPSDCKRYISCGSDGSLTIHECPSGLHFQAQTRQCHYPRQAGCRDRSEEKKDSVVVLEINKIVALEVDRIEGAGAVVGMVGNATVEKEVVRFSCPADERETLHPNPENCVSFLRCAAAREGVVGGVATVEMCEDNRVWNDWEKRCDSKWASTCDGAL